MRNKFFPNLAFVTALVLGASVAQQCGWPSLAFAATPPAAELVEITGADSTPTGAAAIDLAAAGYTEREFHARGKASRYRGALPNALTTATVIDGDWPYHTRVLVRAPNASRFNGTLVVEWANVTAGQDIDFAFAESYEYLLRQGYAIAVLSAQKAGVDRLKTWNPGRYGNLSVDVGNVDPDGKGNIDDCRDMPTCPGDALSWDIMTQVSAALKRNAGPNPPLPGLTVARVISLCESQSAARLTVYYNTIQPIHRFFDGFVYLDLVGQLRADVPVPAISVNSESTAEMAAPRTTSTFTRIWAVPGAAHASVYGIKYVDDMVTRDKSFPGPTGPLGFTQVLQSFKCTLSPLASVVDHGLVLNAALDAVNLWASTGVAVAPSRQFERDASGAVVRDAQGAARGGIQIAQFAAPTAVFSMNGPARFCVLAGHHRVLTATEFKQRYQTHDRYVAQVRDVMQQRRTEGYLLPFDEEAAVTAAAASDVAR